MVVASASLVAADWVVLGLYFVLLAGSGAYFTWRARRLARDGATAYFNAGHTMPVWAVAVSILATAQSAATFVGAPEQSFNGDLAYLTTSLGSLVAAVVLAKVFIPAYYRLGVTTPYQLLEHRFGPGAKLTASWAYMIGRVFASGARVYVGALPVSLAVFGDIHPTHVAIAVVAFMIFGTLYTLAGGISSVIWTDVLQVAVYMGAAVVAIVILWMKVPGDAGDVYRVLADGLTRDGPGPSKLGFGPLGVGPGGVDFATPITLVTTLTGFVLIALASHGTDQDLVQRMLTCKDGRHGARSVVFGILVGVPAVAVFLALGLLLWVYFVSAIGPGHEAVYLSRRADGRIAGDEVFLRFILNEMPAGAAGLMIAGVMAAGPAGINASLNSMASTLVSDVYRPARPGRSEGHYLAVSRWSVVGWGVVLGVFALVCIVWRQHAQQDIINFVLSVMTFAYAGLLGVFGTALFTRRGSTGSAIAAMVVGFVVVLLLRTEVWAWWTSLTPWTRTHLSGVKLAWPWHLVIGVAMSMAVCCVGRRPAAAGREASGRIIAP